MVQEKRQEGCIPVFSDLPRITPLLAVLESNDIVQITPQFTSEDTIFLELITIGSENEMKKNDILLRLSGREFEIVQCKTQLRGY